MIKNRTFLCVALLIVMLLICRAGLVYGETLLTLLPDNVCSEETAGSETINRKTVYIDPEWKTWLNESGNIDWFDPDLTEKLFRDSGIVRSTVSSSHIVNILAEEFRRIRKIEQDLIAKGDLQPLEDGQTYSFDDYSKRHKSMKNAREKHIEPRLKQLYRIYLSALKRKNIRRKDGMSKRSQASLNEFYSHIENQIRILNEGISTIRPGIIKKIGPVAAVVYGEDLPLSYRDGYIVKVRVEKPGTGKSISLYPRMIANQVTDEDIYFLQALDRWREYCNEAYRDALRSLVGWRYGHPALTVTFAIWDWLSGDRKRIEQELPYMQMACEKAQKDFDDARRIHEQMKELTQEELYSLMDLFRQLRFGDIPGCRAEIQLLNERMTDLLGGQKSSASKKFSQAEKEQIDKYAQDVAFYQDIYSSFSNVSTHILSKSK